MQVSHYGHTRPASIAAKVLALQTRCFPAIEAASAPAVASKPAAPTVAPLAAISRAQVAQWQAERAQLRADLPTLRFYAIDAEFGTPGPSFEEVREAEARLETLEDYLIFEPDFAAAPVAEMRLAA